jgi:hypothetical protein
MTDRFFVIRIILRYGTSGAVVLGVLLGVGSAILLWPTISWAVVVVAPLIGGLAFLLCKSYVEIVTIVFSLVH